MQKWSSLAKFRIFSSKINVNKSFSNIDQASDAPLVKQLFYLPFVKIFIENNIIIIERFDILEWEEVITGALRLGIT